MIPIENSTRKEIQLLGLAVLLACLPLFAAVAEAQTTAPTAPE